MPLMRARFVVALAFTLIASSAAADEDACLLASQVSLKLRHDGKLHDAIHQLAICADVACPAEVRAECSRRLDVARTVMPSLVLAAKDGAGNDLTQVTVSMDGAPLLSSLDGRALDIDPGEHMFHFETPGQPALEKKLILREGEKARNEVVVFGPPPVQRPVSPPPNVSSWSTNKTLALGSAGVGIAGVVLGAVFGELAKSNQNAESANCSATMCPNGAQSQADYDTAKQNATASTVFFIAGAAFVATGAVLWFTAPSRRGSHAEAGPRSFHVEPTAFGVGGGGLSFGGDL
jgi:hypothetical protein